MHSQYYFNRIALLLGFIFVGMVGQPIAKASSCCAGGGGQSVCVLNSEQKYQLGMVSSFREIEGHFDPYGNYQANSNENSVSILTTMLGIAYRLNDDWQFAMSIPIVRNEKTFSENRRNSTGIGDPVFEGRYLLWEDLAFLPYRPQLVFYGGIRLPLGKSIYSSKEASEVDVTGEGYMTPHLGVNAAKLYRPVNLVVDASYYYPFAKDVTEVRGSQVSPYTLKPGNRIQLTESATYLHSQKLSTGLGFRQQWQFETAVDGNSTAGSAARLFSSILSVSYFPDANLSFSASYETPAPFLQYLVNQPRGESISLAMIYGGL